MAGIIQVVLDFGEGGNLLSRSSQSKKIIQIISFQSKKLFKNPFRITRAFINLTDFPRIRENPYRC